MKPESFWPKLDALLKHHLPLLTSLEILKKESRSEKEGKYVEELIGRLKAGQALSQAAMCDAVTRGVLLAGERAGGLPQAVERVAARLEGQSKLKAQVIGASVYPLLILLLCVGLCAVLAAVVLPRFEKLFGTLGVAGELPWLTQAVMGAGEVGRRWGLWLLLGLGAAGWGLWRWLRGERWGRLVWQLPLVGRLWRTADRENFFCTLGVMLKSHAPLDEALMVAAQALAHSPLGAAARISAARVREGDTLSESLRRAGGLEESQLQGVALGEHSGSVGESAERLAGLLRERLQVELKAVVSLLEPSLILFMAGFVGLMVAALFMPLGPLVARLAEGG